MGHRQFAHGSSVLIVTTLTMHLPERVIALANRGDYMQTKRNVLVSAHAQVRGTG